MIHIFMNICIIVVLYLLSVNSSNELMFRIVCIRRKIKLIVFYCIVYGRFYLMTSLIVFAILP